MARPDEFLLAEALYPPEALRVTQVAFEAFCQATTKAGVGGLLLHLTPLPGAPAETVDEFLSYLLSASLELHLTGPKR
jgi:hypothetical protein